jgi:hypothetical protein
VLASTALKVIQHDEVFGLNPECPTTINLDEMLAAGKLVGKLDREFRGRHDVLLKNPGKAALGQFFSTFGGSLAGSVLVIALPRNKSSAAMSCVSWAGSLAT